MLLDISVRTRHFPPSRRYQITWLQRDQHRLQVVVAIIQIFSGIGHASISSRSWFLACGFKKSPVLLAKHTIFVWLYSTVTYYVDLLLSRSLLRGWPHLSKLRSAYPNVGVESRFDGRTSDSWPWRGFDLDIPPFPPSPHGSVAMVKVLRPCRSLHGDPFRLELDPTSAITLFSRYQQSHFYFRGYIFCLFELFPFILCLLYSLILIFV